MEVMGSRGQKSGNTRIARRRVEDRKMEGFLKVGGDGFWL